MDTTRNKPTNFRASGTLIVNCNLHKGLYHEERLLYTPKPDFSI